MSEQDPLEGIAELPLSPDDARVVLDLVAEAWDDCADEAYSRGWLHDVAYEEMLHLNPHRNDLRTKPYRSEATSAPRAADQPAEAAGGRRGRGGAVMGEQKPEKVGSRRRGWRAKRRCPHSRLRGIYGDAINHLGARLRCLDCGRLLDGPVALAALRKGEPR